MMFCCGCTLRFTTKFLLWTELVFDSTWLSYSTAAFVFYIRNIDDNYFEFYYGYYMLWSITGIITTVLGLSAIKKRIPALLNGFLGYLYYYVLFESCCLVMLISKPSLYNDIFNHRIRKVNFVLNYDTSQTKGVILNVAWYLFIIVNLIYFVLVVKRYRDVMLEDKPYHDVELQRLATIDSVTRLFHSNSGEAFVRRNTK
ncbi:uncharacterized protein LOC135834676 [Planococcus citri]|uniref:uncharacterized protein LOC135834676 n=1 Tax=Planococcus citri TaxID=170843 RepID=UPI0031F9C419